MANLVQLRMLENLNGFLLVDKPEGIAFSTVVKTVKRKFNLVKVGHGGSLDALASGLLVLLINDANRYVDRVMGADRAYAGTLRLGLRTNTHDVKGVPLEPLGPIPQDAALTARLADVLPQFRGDVFQTESRYCTVRKEGSAAYEVADTGDHAQFLAHVYRFDIDLVHRAANDVPFELRASKGVLPKTLVNDLGEALGCGAALAALRRTRVGALDVAQAIPFQKLLELELKDFAPCVMPLSKALQ